MCVFFTLNHSFYSSTPSTPLVSALILHPNNRQQALWPQNYDTGSYGTLYQVDSSNSATPCNIHSSTCGTCTYVRNSRMFCRLRAHIYVWPGLRIKMSRLSPWNYQMEHKAVQTKVSQRTACFEQTPRYPRIRSRSRR